MKVSAVAFASCCSSLIESGSLSEMRIPLSISAPGSNKTDKAATVPATSCSLVYGVVQLWKGDPGHASESDQTKSRRIQSFDGRG